MIYKKVVYSVLLLLLFRGYPSFAQQYDTDSLQQITLNGSEKDKLAALQLLANLSRNNNPQQALGYLSQAIDKARILGDKTSLATCLQLSGSIENRNGNFQHAKELFLESLNLFVDANNKKGQADVTVALSGIYFMLGNLPLAADGYLRGLRYYEEVNNKAGMVTTLSALGNIYARQNNFSKSIEYNLRALSLYEESSDKNRALVGYDNIGNIYLRQNNPSKAREYFTKSLLLYTEMKNDVGIAATLLHLGAIEQAGGKHEEAVILFKRSLAISTRLKAQTLIVSTLNAQGKSYTQLRLYDQAIDCFRRSINIAKSSNMKIELEESYQGLAAVYKLTKELEKATTFSNLSEELKDSIYNDSSLKKLTDQLLVYESEKKQQQIELLHKEQQIRESDLTREREIRTLLTIAAVILGVLFIVLVIFSVQNRRIAKSLRKQQAELIEKNSNILEQTEKLDQLNKVKDRFFSIISHDLRNNLTTMKLYFDLISNKDYVPQDNGEITKQISGSVENTIDLLENLLVWASTQIKGVPIHIQKLNVHSLSEENINLLSGNAHHKNITLRNEVSEDALAYGDIDMINLVLRNLITNAIKFTPENGRVVISSSIENNMRIISIQDNGIGISAENLDKLFNQHLHPTTKGTANEKGTGLGLILCKDFVNRNRGDIWAESHKNNGTTFFFSLPLQA
ncbi:MAG: tetratricopeptide repeat-containing sensor histidine kinase [Bacteroidota bacterium]